MAMKLILFSLILLTVLCIESSYANVPNKTPEFEPDSDFYSSPSYNTLTFHVQKGDTFLTILGNLNIGHDEVLKATRALKKYFNVEDLALGQQISITFYINDQEPYPIVLQSVRLPVNYEYDLEATRDHDGSFKVKKYTHKVETKIVGMSGIINQSLFQTASKMNLSERTLMDVINAYSYDIDFQREIRRGDKIKLLVERVYDTSGKVVHDNKILYAELILNNKPHIIYRYNNSFYDSYGRHVKKSLLRTPINGARISSNYGRRRHPILGYTKMHKGVDFAASRGTPILAAGEGEVTYIGRRGGYGKYIRIKHNKTYSTAYAHASRFKRGLRLGSKVKQGQVIAYVGTTGRSTGPHLHYEVLLHGKAINPLKFRVAPGRLLRGKNLAKFKNYKKDLDVMVANIPHPTNLATRN